MDEPIHPINLERSIQFDPRHPVAKPLVTPFPGQVLLIGLRAGQHLRDHRVTAPITIHVVRGEGSLTVDAVSYPVQSGAFLPLEAGIVHGVSAATDLVLLVHRAAVAVAEADGEAATPRADGDCPVLDVRALAPRERHARIFAAFAALPPGGAFRLVNDHDPKPLRYQFAAEHAGEATWTPEREGPAVSVIRIGKAATPAAAGA